MRKYHIILISAVGSSVLRPVEKAQGPAATQSQLWPSENSRDTRALLCPLDPCDPCADPQEKAGHRNPPQVKDGQVSTNEYEPAATINW